MDTLRIEQTKSTPLVAFDSGTNTLQIEGQSYPENAFKFFEPLFLWLDRRLASLEGVTFSIYIHMPYINTSSSKCVMMLLEKLEQAYLSGKQVSICWHYDADNEMALECAEEFKEDLTLPFEIRPTEAEK